MILSKSIGGSQMEARIPVTTKKREHKGKEGLIHEDGKTIYDDSWLHPSIFDEEEEKSSNRHIRTLINKDKPKLDKSVDLIVELPIHIPLLIDLNKGRLNTAKLVRRPVQVHGANGKVFTRMMWVDPKTGQPVNHVSSKEPEPQHKTRKDFIDHKVKNMSDDEKYAMVDKHKIPFKHNDHPAILHKNKVMALKDHLNKNPDLIGAGHLPESTTTTPDGTDKINAWMERFRHNSELMYKMMKDFGIAQHDPRDDDNDKSGPIKHMHNMMKLKAHLKDNPHLMDSKEFQPSGTNPKPVTSSPKSIAQQGGNTVDGILKRMTSDELYTLMRNNGIADSDPRNDKDDKVAPVKHMRNMMKLKALIGENPDLLNSLGFKPETDDGSGEGKGSGSPKDLGSFNDENSKWLSESSRGLKEKLIKKYDGHADMKDRPRNSNPNIDYMQGVTALKKLFTNHPELAGEHAKEAENEQLMNYKIGNKNMAKVLREALKLKGVGDVKIVEDGIEWSYGTGFVRREQDNTGEPILSVVDTGKDGNGWDEHIIPVRDAKKLLEGNSNSINVTVAPLDKMPLEKIGEALDHDFEANYTPAVGERLKAEMPNLYKNSEESTYVSHYAPKLGDVSIGTMNKIFAKWGIKTTDLGGRDMVALSGIVPFKTIVFKDMISPNKGDKNANDFIYKGSDGRTDVFPLHASARKWDDEEKASARKDLIHSSIHMLDTDKLPDHEERMNSLKSHLHIALSHVPFDIFSHMLANGLKIRFPSKDHIGNHLPGSHYLSTENVIEFNHAYYTDSKVFKSHPMDFNTSPIPHPTIQRATTTQTHFGDAAPHEFAHAMDHFLSAHYGFLNWQGANASRYVEPEHRNCVRDSYNKAVMSSNPDKILGKGGVSQDWLYHKDNWLSTYEGRIYDQSYYKDESRKDNVGFDTFKQVAYDKSYDPNAKGKVGLEHWSENVSRYAGAKMAYDRYKEDYAIRQGEPYDKTMSEWAEDHYNDGVRYGYKPDQEDGEKQFRHKGEDSSVGTLWHEVGLRYPDLKKAIHSILDRADFRKGDQS